MAADDDLDWIAAVAGRPRAGTDPRTLQEAALLRAAARTWTPRPLPAEAQRSDATETLLARARREGVLARTWCPGCAARWRGWRELSWATRGLGLALVAMLAVMVFGVLPPLQRDDRPDPVLRGAPADGVWLLRSATPQAQRDRIADELAAAGLSVRRYERLGRHGLDAEVTAASAGAVAPVLRRHGVQAGPDGVLRIEVEKAGP
jgi:hypothetical protein